MHPAPHLSPAPASLTESLSQQDRAADCVNPEDGAASDCGMTPTTMTDEEREAAIKRIGRAMVAWHSQYRLTGNPRSLDMARAAEGIQRKLIAGRRPGGEQA